MKTLIVLLASAVVYGCGGGGGDTPVTEKTIPEAIHAPALILAVDKQITLAMSSQGVYVPSLVLGNFSNDGAKYVLSAGWISNNAGGWPNAPIKILKINADNTATDATTTILGSEQLGSTNIPIVADFNGDGIDDIFLPGFRDMPAGDAGSVVFLSRAGQSHQRVDLPDQVWSHGATAVDINGDGTIDVVNSQGRMWLNDGRGNFTFRDYAHNLNNRITDGTYINGSGVCAGDFNNTGHAQIVITDVSNTSQQLPIADTIIFELDSQLQSINYHVLPVPVKDRGKTTETSHDVACQVADINGDGKLDIIVTSRPLDSARNGQWTGEGSIQIYLNRGNWVFTDITDTIVGYDQNVIASYTPMVMDLNNDGKLDIWLGAPASANQALLNTNGTVMSRAMKSVIDSYGAIGPMIPVKFGNQWSLVYTKFSNCVYTYYISANKVQF